jgi:hypothetical protein
MKVMYKISVIKSRIDPPAFDWRVVGNLLYARSVEGNEKGVSHGQGKTAWHFR